VQEYLFREFLEALCQAIGATLDEFAWNEIRGLVDRTESAGPVFGSCLRETWAKVTLAGTAQAQCEFSFESVASWILLRVEVPADTVEIVQAAMIAAQRC